MQKHDGFSRLKDLFRELFQLDVSDLDFGLYRLFRLKWAEVEAFLDKQLPAEVDRAFDAVTGEERERLQKRVEDLAMQARNTVADDAILLSGLPNPLYTETKAVKEYAEALKRLRAVDVSEAQRAEVFNLLYTFFSRYYDEGDFVSRRFHSARPAYAIPYKGEEVFFHWANKDQYYVKSGEAFHDYAFTVSTVDGQFRVRFKLVEATAQKDNTKGDIRFFFPRSKDTAYEDATRTFTVPFEYRLPTEAEVTKYGKNAKGQGAILDESVSNILKDIPEEMLRGALAAPSPTGKEIEGEKPATLLRYRLAHFTKKHTSDYFVHKDLGAFLRQELEFFIRDQVVHELDLEGDFDAKRRMLNIFRKLANTVITFLAQIEDVQKRLFEKRKFVLRTDYLIPIQHVQHALQKEVLANKAQLAEWKALYALSPKSDLFNFKGQVNEHVLEQHPTLVVDTRHFSTDFSTRLLEAIEDIDSRTEGMLIQGENFQALSLTRARYREQVNCIHIDPPYNT
jgi:adenine-specific DNA-methyltransferase